MERRRLTRASAEVTTTVPAKQTTTAKRSPSRKVAPRKDKSPSPVRKPSPARVIKTRASSKSPARETVTRRAALRSAVTETTKTDVKIERRVVGRRKKESTPERDARVVAKQKESISNSPRIVLKLLDNDDEVSRISGKSSPRNRNDTPESTQRSAMITPTSTERSRQSESRSVSMMNEEPEEFSDQEEPEFESFRKDDNGLTEKKYLRRSATKQLQELSEFGGSVGALLLVITIPLFVFTINYFCSGPHKLCYISTPSTFNDLTSLATYVNMEIGIIFLLFMFGIKLFTALPIGKSVTINDDRGMLSYNFTGLSCAFFTFLAIFVTEYCYKYPLIITISKNYMQLLSISVVYALLQSVFSYIRAKYTQQYLWNPYAKTNKFIVDFFIGREINPQAFNRINLKLENYHLSVVMGLIFNGIILFKNLKFAAFPIASEEVAELSIVQKIIFAGNNLQFDNVSVLVSGLTILYLLDLLVYEHHLTCSFELQNEGVGALLLLRYAVFPFTMTLLPKYVSANKLPNVPLWMIAAIAVVFIIGLVIKRSSNRLKYTFRMYPKDPKYINLCTLPTFQGRRLLVTSWWKRVRQPNYAGDILQNIAMLPLLYWRFAWPPLLAALFTVVLLVHRSKRVNDRNAKKYNSSWQRYCTLVPNMLVPKVF